MGVMVPKETAAWLFFEDPKEGRATVMLRMKKLGEYSELTSLLRTREETGLDQWQPVSTAPYRGMKGGIPNDANPYYKITFKHTPKGWAFEANADFRDFIASQGKLGIPGAPLPSRAQVDPDELKKILLLAKKLTPVQRDSVW